MNESIKMIRLMTISAVVLQAISTIIFCIAYMMPEPILSSVAAPSSFMESASAAKYPLLFVSPLLCMIVVGLFGWLLLRECAGQTQMDLVLLILIPACAVMLNLVSRLLSVMCARMITATEMGVVATLDSAISWRGLFTLLVFPLLLGAAGINWGRKRNSQ